MANRWSLWFDVLWGRTVERLGTSGRYGELNADTHLFLFDRYSRLAEYHRLRGHVRKADRLLAKAEEHRVDVDDGPPYAAAMAMPRPRLIRTNAVSRSASHHPDDAA